VGVLPGRVCSTPQPLAWLPATLVGAIRNHARLFAAIVLLALLAAPAWPSTVDDVYISLTYARHWAESGALEWSTGERVEGYSNFLFVAAMALAARLGLDMDLLAQVVAFVAGTAPLVLLHRRLGPGTPATLCLLALAAWAPLGHWSVIGLETTLYAALLAGGWSLVLGSPSSWGGEGSPCSRWRP
jgi:hypothetical protein